MVIKVTSPGRRTSDKVGWQGYSAAEEEISNQYGLIAKLGKYFMSGHKPDHPIFTLVMWILVEAEKQTQATKLNE